MFKTASTLYDELIQRIDGLSKVAEDVAQEDTPPEGNDQSLSSDELIQALKAEALKAEEEDGNTDTPPAEETPKQADDHVEDDKDTEPREDKTPKNKDKQDPGQKDEGANSESSSPKPKDGLSIKEASALMMDVVDSKMVQKVAHLRKTAGIPVLSGLRALGRRGRPFAGHLLAGGVGAGAGIAYGQQREEAKDQVEDDMIYNIGIRNGAVAMANAISDRLESQNVQGTQEAPVEGAPND